MRILFVTARPPWPGRRGDQIRTAGLVQALAERHEVRIVAQCWPNMSGTDAESAPSETPVHTSPAGEITHGVEDETRDPITEEVSLPGRSPVAIQKVPISYPRLLRGLFSSRRRPLQVALHHHREFRLAVRREIERFAPDVAVVVLSRIGDVVKELESIPCVVDLVDALALNMAQRGDRQSWLRRFWVWEAQRMARWDRHILDHCQAAMVVAERDRRYLVGGDEKLARRIRVVPLGIEMGRQDPLAVARRPIVSLTGNLGYFPTVDGAVWFGEKVWPMIRQRMPRAEWWLAGSRPARPIRRLDRQPGVRLIPHPEDMGSVLQQTAVSVAPLFSGSGTPIKILEAMAYRVPVVTTAAGRAGLDDIPAEGIVSSDHPESFAKAVVRFLEDRRFAFRTTLAATRWMLLRHDRERTAGIVEDLLHNAIEQFATDRLARPEIPLDTTL